VEPTWRRLSRAGPAGSVVTGGGTGPYGPLVQFPVQLTPAGQVAAHERLEVGAVVRYAQVGKLVDHHVLEQFRPPLRERQVEPDALGARVAAAPARLHALHAVLRCG